MTRYEDVMQRVIAMTDTMEEGLIYVKVQYQANQYEKGRTMLLDVFEAFYQIERAMGPILPNLSTNMIKEFHTQLREKFQQLTTVLAGKMPEEAGECLDDQFAALFEAWKKEIQRCLQPLIIAGGDNDHA